MAYPAYSVGALLTPPAHTGPHDFLGDHLPRGGMIAAVLGLSGIAGAATNVAWYCAGICLALAIAIGIFGRKPPE